ncbi:MAG: ISKra4 family transposase [Chloroflexia bacterium]
MPGPWTPTLHEGAVRLGAWLPFAQAARLLAAFAHTALSEPTVRRQTEAAGAAYVALQAAAAEDEARGAAAPPPGPPVLQLSVDGAMVPLVGGAWAEVKTLALGLVEAQGDGAAPRASHLSYFSRLADHATFARLALAETARRGVGEAGVVVALCDGAAWAQAFIDAHRPDAVRILDWCHAAGYLGQVAEACFGADPAQAARWLAAQTRELLEGDPDRVLGKLRGLREGLAPSADPAAQAKHRVVATSLQYLEARRDQIQYAAFRAAGYPIGSGAVESANKLVVEARLKGAGMHWARPHVDPMLALRNIACADRWGEAWPAITAELRRQARARLRRTRAARRPAAPAPPPRTPLAPPAPACVLALPTGRHEDGPPAPPTAATRPAAPRPAPTHPWRRYPATVK